MKGGEKMFYLIVLTGLLLVGYFCTEKIKDSFLKSVFRDHNGMSLFCGFLIIIFCMGIIVGIITYFESMSGVAKLEAFYNETCIAYKYTVEKSENITINAIKDVKLGEILNTGNLTYFELAKSVNVNLRELRDAVKEYNNRLYIYKTYNNNWFTDSFICDIPEYLKPIKIK